MALIQYTLQKDANGEYGVSCTVLELGKNDRIQFTSNFPGAAVKYQGTPPFHPPRKGDPLPAADEPFPVPDGKGIAGPFTVTQAVTNKIHVECGMLERAVSTQGGSETKFKSFGVGFDHPTGN